MNQARNESGPQFDNGIADSIRVELHNATSPYEFVSSFGSTYLQTNGTINIKTFTSDHTGTFYVVIKNRNSVETWSANPITINSLVPLFYDFSTSASQAYGNNLKLMSDNVYAIFSGDANQDCIVDASDMAIIDNSSTAIKLGYYPEDLNGDGIVDASDMAIIDNNSTAVVHVMRP